MSVNIDLTSVTKKEFSSNYVQYIPCSIEYDGNASLEKYFSTYIRPETVTDEKGNENKVLNGMFRGYPLTGSVMPVPEGYTGVVLKETRPGLNSDAARTVKGICQFKEFTFWNWDRKPSRGDKYQQAMDWAEISELIHDDK